MVKNASTGINVPATTVRSAMITGNLVTNLAKCVNAKGEPGHATIFHVKEPVLFLRTRM